MTIRQLGGACGTAAPLLLAEAGVAGRKSDHGDSFILASVLRTGMHAYRPLPAGTEPTQAIAVLARARQDAGWDQRRPVLGAAATETVGRAGG
jgi:hypothetical protein